MRMSWSWPAGEAPWTQPDPGAVGFVIQAFHLGFLAVALPDLNPAQDPTHRPHHGQQGPTRRSQPWPPPRGTSCHHFSFPGASSPAGLFQISECHHTAAPGPWPVLFLFWEAPSAGFPGFLAHLGLISDGTSCCPSSQGVPSWPDCPRPHAQHDIL